MSQHGVPDNQSGQSQARFANTLLSAAYNSQLTRRQALGAALAAAGAAVLFGLPQPAFAASASQETLDALAAAEEELAEVEAQLDEIAEQYEELSAQQDETIAAIEEVTAQIATIEAEIAVKQAELEEKQELLAERVSSDYKSGGTSFLSLLISASSFEDLISSLYYADKINESDQETIAEIDAIQAELEAERTELESQKTELEELQATQEEQLASMKAKQAEISDLVSSLSDEVTELMEKRDEEYLAAVAEEEAQAAAAAAAAAASSSSATYDATNVPDNAQALVVAACNSVASPGAGYCARWVSLVFQKAGFTYYGGNACDMYNSWCTSSDRSYLQTAMIIAVSTHTHTSAGRVYGHVGIYVGGSTVMDNVGYIRSIGVDSWISYFGTTVTPRWGWIGGVDLS